MTRFLSREEWPVVAAGIVAGLLAALLLLYAFYTGITGDTTGQDALLAEGDTVTAAADSLERAGASAGDSGPMIGAREFGIQQRLDAHEVPTEPLRGRLSIVARDVQLVERSGARFLRSERVTAGLDLDAVQRGDVVLHGVVVTRPVVALREAGGDWNYEQIFAELLDGGDDGGSGGGGRKRLVQLRDVTIDGGDVTVVRPDQRLAFRRVEAELPLVVFSQEGVAEPYLRASSLTMDLFQLAPEPIELAVRVEDALVLFPDGTVRFDVASALVNRTRLADAKGVWDPSSGGYGVTAEGRAIDAHFEDFPFMLPPTFPKTGLASFAWAVKPTPTGGTEVALSEMDARTGESRVLGAVSMRIEKEAFALLSTDLRLDPLAVSVVEEFLARELPYDGFLNGRVRGTGGDIGFDLTASLTAPTVTQPFQVAINGRVRSSTSGFTIRDLVLGLDRVPLAALRPIAPGLAMDGFVTGRVGLRGDPGTSPLALDVRLEMAGGVALVDGTLDLTGAVARYDLEGRLVGVDLQALLAYNVPPAALTAAFTLAGSGFDPATMDAAVTMAGRFTGWQTDSGDTLRVAAHIRGGGVRVDTLIAGLATAELAASGDWRFVEPQSGAVAYAVNIAAMEPFGPYLPVIGDSAAAGALHATGTMSGTLQRMQLAGQAALRDFTVGGWRAALLDADYDMVLGGGSLPIAVVNARGEGLVTPTAGHYDVATVELRLTPPGLALQVDATRTDGGLVEVTATGTLPETGERRVVLESARFDLADDRWVLQRPATVRWVPGGVTSIDGLEILAEQSDGRVFVDGAIYPYGGVDAALQIEALPVGEIQRLLGQPARVEGLLWAQGTLRGGAETSAVDIDFRIEEGAIQGVPLQQLAGELTYRERETRLVARAVVDSAGRLDVDVRLPSIVRIGATPRFELIDGAPLAGTITADRFALAPLAATIPQVRDVTGVVDIRATLAGTADAPSIAGDFTLREGGVHVIPLNQTYTEITGDVSFDGRQLTFQDVRARSDGWATVGGRVVLERLDEPVLDLDVTLDEFRALGVDDQTDAAVDGRVALDGPLDAIVLTGGITIRDGTVVIPQFGAGGLDRELVDMTRPATTLGTRPGDDAGGWMENLRIQNLQVAVRDAWFEAAQTGRVQLSGDLTVNRQGDNFPIVGTLNGTRGQYTLVAGPIIRRFDIIAAQVRFIGSPQPDPAIDITARRVVLDQSGRQLDVDVRITGTVANPRLGLAGGEGPAIAESELLSYLIFGQPSFALGGDFIPGEDLLQQTFVGGVAEVLALELERSLGGLGLDVFQVRLDPGPFGGLGSPTFVLGREVRDDVFLTVETGINALFGGGDDASFNAWAVRLDWAFDPRSRLRLAIEPVYRGRMLRSAGLALPSFRSPRHQLLLEARRRWIY